MPKTNWGAGASGAASGAITGASIGGPWGAAIGGAVGGVAGLFGGGKKKKKRSTLDKKQKALNDIQHQSVLGEGPLADLYNYNPEQANEVFDKNIANPAYRNFKEKLAPEITGQFRSNGLMQSSYAGDALSKLARDIQEGLDAKRSEYMYGEQKDARSAKRNAVENLQNRQTFAYDTAAPQGGFNINSILDQVTPERIDQFKDWYNKPAAAPTSTPVAGGIS